MSSEQIQITEITPNHRQQLGTLGSLRALAWQLTSHRSQIRGLFSAQWHGFSRGTKLGVLWNYVIPIVPLGVYVLLAEVRVLPNFEGVRSALYITVGVTVWFLFVGAIQVPIATVSNKRSESLRTSFPLVCSIAANYAQLLFETAVRIVCISLVFVAYKFVPPATALAFPLLMIPALVLFASLGLLLSILNAIHSDVMRITAIVLQYGLFLSGVIFPVHEIKVLASWNSYNPFAVYVGVAREVTLKGELDVSFPFAAWSIAGLAILLVSARVFYVMEERIKD